MIDRVAFIGFGEAGQAFAAAPGWAATMTTAYDIATRADATRAAKLADYERAGITGGSAPAEALDGAVLVLSVVTADQALAAAAAAAAHLGGGALYCDMNSVAPQTKREAEQIITGAGGRYVDVAVMAPVHPQRLATPLLLSGSHAEIGAAALSDVGFANLKVVGAEVGRAAAIKLIRSVMVKGVEALTAEMMLAARAADVVEDVLHSLGGDWPAKAAYNLERMQRHGLRRAAEMEEAARTLSALGIDPVMTCGTVRRQREMAT